MKIKNWSKFQHFKDRRPPWVKLYRDILDDIDWHELDPLAAKVLVMLWLIASEDEGRVPEIKTLAFRLRLTESKTKELINKLSHWLEHDDINVISDCNQVDSTETERETKKEKEKKVEKPEGVSIEVWDAFIKHRKSKNAQITPLVMEVLIKEAEKAKWLLEDALREVIVRNWQSFKADWVLPKFNNSDIAKITVPMSDKPDPALEKIKADAKKAAPIPENIRQAMAAIRSQP
jgi:exopolysaccharide biosynthesis protein